MPTHRLLRVHNGGQPEAPVAPALGEADIFPSEPFINDLDRYLWHRHSHRANPIAPPETALDRHLATLVAATATARQSLSAARSAEHRPA